MEYNEALLNCIVAGVIYQESMDVLKTTNYYKQDIKQLINKLEPKLERFLDETTDMCFHDHLAFYHMQDEFKNLIKQIGNLAPVEISIFSDICCMINQKRDWVMSQLKIQEVESSEIELWNKRQQSIDIVSKLDENQVNKLNNYLTKFKIV